MSGRSDCIYTKKSAIGRSDFIYTKKSARPTSNEPAKMSWGTMQEKITANTRQKCVVQGSKKSFDPKSSKTRIFTGKGDDARENHG